MLTFEKVRRVFKKKVKSAYHQVQPLLNLYSSSDFWQLNSDCLSGSFKISSSSRPRFNILLPSLLLEKLSGGPNTVLQFALRLCERGIPIRLLSQNTGLEYDAGKLDSHFKSLLGRDVVSSLVECKSFCVGEEVEVSPKDTFMATAWWTAQALKRELRDPFRSFFYFIQDFEPGFYGWGMRHALALETYSFPILPIINSESLAVFFQRSGLLNSHWEPQYFDPALDRRVFNSPQEKSPKTGKKLLLFYARPGVGPRNLYEMGLESIYKLTKQKIINPMDWDLFFIGEQIPGVRFDNGWEISCHPWLSYLEYGKLLQRAHVVLAPMMSPHPSYTPLEAAACGNLVVTTTFENKNSDYFAGLSNNIISSDATVDALFDALVRAVSQCSDLAFDRAASTVKLPLNWDDALGGVLSQTESFLRTNMTRDGL